MSMEIVAPGMLTTVQDAGRTGYLALGMGAAGVMDRDAMDRANRMAGNQDASCAVLECTMMGPSIRFDEDTVVAIAGADMQASVKGVPVPRDRAFVVLKGQTLTLGMAVNGCRAYIAVRGGVDVPVVMGSRSTDLKCRVGGYLGRALKKGDVLPVGDDSACDKLCVPQEPVVYREQVTVGLIPGPQYDRLTENGKQALWGSSFIVTADSDRMGIRLDGAVLENKGTDIVSEGLVFGSVQLPANGRPIILMADHQTTGGYARVGTVCSADLPVLAQLRPGGRITFVKKTVEQAQRKHVQQQYRK